MTASTGLWSAAGALTGLYSDVDSLSGENSHMDSRTEGKFRGNSKLYEWALMLILGPERAQYRTLRLERTHY